jgi:predicted O-methyltransferase YrrM
MQIIKRLIENFKNRKLNIQWTKKNLNSFLYNLLKDKSVIKPKQTAFSKKINILAEKTNELGAQNLWEGYSVNNRNEKKTRMPNLVRTKSSVGDFFTYLVIQKKPNIIVEFGTAFGVSGMYFLSGIETIKKGELLTFEVNKNWAELAFKNLEQISKNFKLTVGTFEENIEDCLEKNRLIDIAFIDGIHTKEFVIPQLEIVVKHCNKGALIILDDIDFSENMAECWAEVSMDNRFISSLKLGNRVGVLELK